MFMMNLLTNLYEHTDINSINKNISSNNQTQKIVEEKKMLKGWEVEKWAQTSFDLDRAITF